MRMKYFLAAALIAAFSISTWAEDFSKYAQVKPKVTTGRTGRKSLAGNADDPAVWIHPTNPAKSLIFGVDKSEGLWVWTLDGKELTAVDPSGKVGNVDVRNGFNLGGKKVDIVALNLRKVAYKSRVSKVAIYAINPDWTSGADVLKVLCNGKSSGNDLQTGTYGFTLYKDSAKDKMYIFEAPDSEPYMPRQYEIISSANGDSVTVKPVRDLAYSGGVNEGMVADDDEGYVYIAEESYGIHKYLVSPDADPKAVSTFALKSDGYRRDREGIALYNAGPGKGYLIVVDQAEKAAGTFSVYRIYDRITNKLVKTVVPLNKDGDNLWDDDGVDANGSPLPGFPHGIVIGHDGDNSNYPIYDWADFAGKDLILSGK
ncbi:MAG: phytase [Spirochaetia bacterium]|jgi:3-phytase|nr:phytase [Spirochaetia bacterium]